ncbi:hypothetical protein ACFV0B_13130 [Streptomyces xanthophaeus]|uniref:DinB/UmuC family translesion DNA polymerase n=1 Tax=Streptomyces xanthophaeus TaxID=67385 RepID=UPI0036C8EB75
MGQSGWPSTRAADPDGHRPVAAAAPRHSPLRRRPRDRRQAAHPSACTRSATSPTHHGYPGPARRSRCRPRAPRTRPRTRPPRTVQTGPTAKSLAADRAFEHDVLDPGEHGRAVLDRAEEVAARPRNGQQAAGGLFLSARYADRTSSTRSRTLPATTARPRQLTATPYELHDLVGLQRARVRGISLRPQDLRPAARATEQLTLEPDDDHSRAVEAVTDRARARYGPGALRPAALASSRIRRA